jgi:dipeptidyl aminopeptidase/acylaminoacyl peptidase
MHSPGRTLLALVLTGAALTAADAQQPSMVRDGVALPDPQIAAELPRYLSAEALEFVDWLSDGTLLLLGRSHGTSQVQRVQLPLRPLQQLSFARTAVEAVVARPYTSDVFIYVAADAGAGGTDTGGAAQLYLQQIDAPARLLGETRTDRGAPAWAHDGKRIAYVGSGAAGVYVLDTSAADAQPRLIASASEARWHVLGWARDDSTLLLGRERDDSAAAADAGLDAPSAPDTGRAASSSASTSAPSAIARPQLELYLADVRDGSLQPVPLFGARRRTGRVRASSGPNNGIPAALASEARFASDGHAVVLLTRQPCQSRDAAAAHEFVHLCLTDPADGEWRQLSASAPHDVELFDQSADGSLLAYTIDDEGVSRLMLLDQQLQRETAVTQLGPGVITALKFNPTGARLALTFESARSSPDAYVLDPHTSELARWTRSDAGVLDGAGFTQPQLVHFPTWDDIDGQPRQLSALLYGLGGAVNQPTSPRPLVVLLCSGEGQQCRPRYQPFVQYLVQKLGFAVIAPNVRGSAGFGPSFESAGMGPLQDDAIRDIGSLLVWTSLQPALDRGRVALLGEGFGGYLALASLSQFGDRLSGAVAAFPRRSWVLPNALAIRRPVLLVQGLADPAVPPYQIAQLREGLRASGVSVQYLAADGERGRFEHAGSIEAYYETAATFLERLLH